MSIGPHRAIHPRRREELADVTQAARSEDRVDHGMREHVGVRVPGEAARVLDLDPAEGQSLVLSESVAVVADPNAQGHQASSPLPSTRTNPPASPIGLRRRSRPSNTQIRSTPEVGEELDRLLVAEPDLVRRVGVGGERELRPGLDAQLRERTDG
jgi:hypothetical protein